MKRSAFTMVELIFVIVIMGILGKFGVEFIMKAYEGFIFSSAQNRLQSQSEAAITQIAKRLQYRIKDSVIARGGSSGVDTFRSLANADGSEQMLEWVGSDIDGWRGEWNGAINAPAWSGFIDVDAIDDPLNLYVNDANETYIISPATDTGIANTIIGNLSDGDANFNTSALFFIGGNSNIINGYGWDGTSTDQNDTMHPIVSAASDAFAPRSATGDFGLVDIFEYYKLAWSAYAIEHTTTTLANGTPTGTLLLWYDYQPWLGERNTAGKSVILAEHVDTFRFRAIGDVIKIQVCTTDEDIFKEGEYSVCKEKTIF